MSIIKEMKRVVNEVIDNPKKTDDVVFALIKAFGGERMNMPANDYERRNREIKELYKNGANVGQLSRRYQLSERTIYRILDS